MWFYVKHNTKQGAVSTEQLQSLYSSNEIDANTLVWREGQAEWLPISQIEELTMPSVSLPPPIPTVLVSPYQPAGRWKRFFARMLDVLLATLIASVAYVMALVLMLHWLPESAYLFDSPVFVVGSTALIVVGLFIFDALIYGIFGNTLGKALLKVRVLDDASKQRLDFKLYLKRNFQVLLKGFYLNIPLLNIMAFIVQYVKVGKQGKTDYDADLGTQAYAEKTHWFKIVLYVVLFYLIAALYAFTNMMVEVGIEKAVTEAVSNERHSTSTTGGWSNVFFTPDLEQGIATYKSGDKATAHKHFSALAYKGNAAAMYAMAIMSESVEEEYAWYNLASAYGKDDAREERNKLAKEMTAQQIEAGQEKTRALQKLIKE